MLSLLFFLSGVTALLSESVWIRLSLLTFGSSPAPERVIVAAILFGLALGAVAGQHSRLRRHHPLVVYSIIAGMIASFALLFPTLIRILALLATASAESRFFTVFSALFTLTLPATLIGLTLPTLARYLISAEPIGRQVGRLSALLSSGAACGALFVNARSLDQYDTVRTALIAVALNVTVCLLALALPRNAPSQEQTTRHSRATGASAAFLVFPFLLGFIGLALVMLWKQIFVCALPDMAHIFTATVTGILLGFTCGAWLYVSISRFRISPQTHAFIFFLSAGTCGVFVLFSLTLFNHLPVITRVLTHHLGESLWLGADLSRIAATAVITFMPAVISGAALLIFVDVRYARSQQTVEQVVGSVFGASALGGVVGIIVSESLLLPFLGLSHSLVVLALFAIALGILFFLRHLTAPSQAMFAVSIFVTVGVMFAVFLLPKELTVLPSQESPCYWHHRPSDEGQKPE